MKKTILFISCLSVIITTVCSQDVTSFGLNAGAAGEGNCNFGQWAGYDLDVFTKYNTAAGYQALGFSGNDTIEGDIAIGARALMSGGDESVAVGVDALQYGRGGSQNVAVGGNALNSNNSGDNNTGVGYAALSNTSGNYNSALGYRALSGAGGTGSYNTAIGASALFKIMNGTLNTAQGYQSLYENDGGSYNTAAGSYSLHKNKTGNNNTASGYYALFSNTTGYQNTAIGYRTLYGNSTGYYNTAIGANALNTNINGNFNTATGCYAGYGNNIGTHNTANGFRALQNNTTGNYNTAYGAFALYNVIGGTHNSALGYNAGPTTNLLNNTTAVGYLAIPTASNQVRLGNTSVTSIGGEVEWTEFSDGRFKKDIKEDVSGLNFINALRPVSYTVDKHAINKFLHINDSSATQIEGKNVRTREAGFVAQEVESLVKNSGYVFSGVDAPENDNDIYGIRYAEFVVPLTQALHELSEEFESQEQYIQSLLSQLAQKK